jgi:hypothetical protein
MSTSPDSAFQLRMGAPDRMLMTFDGPWRPLGAWLQAIFEARHAASTKFWAKAVEGCHTIGDLRDVMARHVPPPTADYYFGGADAEITMADNVRAFQAVRLNPRMGVKFDEVDMKFTVLGEEISMPVIAAPGAHTCCCSRSPGGLAPDFLTLSPL